MTSSPVRLCDHRIPSPPVSIRSAHHPILPVFLSNQNNPTAQRRRGRLSPWILSGVLRSRALPILCSMSDGIEVPNVQVGDVDESSSDRSGPEGVDGGRIGKGFSSNEMMQRLKRYGVAGVLSYGLLNTIYYLTMFLLVWFYFAPAPGRMGYAAAVERFLKVMAMVWAGSQVTKIVRAAGHAAASS